MKYHLFVPIFTQFFIGCLMSLSPFRTPQHPTRSDFQEEEIANSKCDDQCACLASNFTLINPKKVINPYTEQLKSRVLPKPFGSFCIKCAACLAVANEIQNVIELANQECETDIQKKMLLIHDIEEKINFVCSKGFKNFDLRSYKNHPVITSHLECTQHLVTKMDGDWTKKLREICSLYISRVNIEDITLNVLDSIGNLTEIFCRGTGVFRDCSNFKGHDNITVPNCQECALG